MLADTPSLGLVIGLPIGALVCITFAVIGALAWYRDWNDDGFVRYPAPIIALGALVITAVAMWPYSYDYHFWKNVNGRVQRVSSRFVSAGDSGGTNQRFVVVIDGQPYGVDDTRASLVKPGDMVYLKCKREYEWGSSHNGYGCRWNGAGA